MWADSTRCLSTFWPYDVRYRSRPSSMHQLGVQVGDADLDEGVLARALAQRARPRRGPARSASSMRCGWMRPSRTSASSASRATSRRTGSKQDSSTASGVSSMIRLTPVTCSKARMLRPSRPMMRPFMSSLGRCRTDTTDSVVCSVASRWIAPTTISRARGSPSRWAACSMSRASSGGVAAGLGLGGGQRPRREPPGRSARRRAPTCRSRSASSSARRPPAPPAPRPVGSRVRAIASPRSSR